MTYSNVIYRSKRHMILLNLWQAVPGMYYTLKMICQTYNVLKLNPRLDIWSYPLLIFGYL